MRVWLAVAAVILVIISTVSTDPSPDPNPEPAPAPAPAPSPKEEVRCRRGFWPVGSMCYKIVREKADWQSAALYCGAHGAGLARYDSDADKPLKDFFNLMTRFLYSAKKEVCNDKHKDCAARAARNGCQKNPHWMIPNCRRSCGMCKSTTPLSTWVGGNTKVLHYGKRDGETPLQVDPPRNFKKYPTKGCYRAYLTKCGMFWLEPNSNCDHKQEFICGYDNTAGYKYEKCENKNPKCEEWAAAGECKKNPGKMIATCRLACDKCERDFTPEYDPFNFVITETEVTYSEAIIKCNSMNRPVASIMTAEQQTAVERIVKKKGKHAWISATYDANRRAFRWAGNYFVDYSNWHDTVVRDMIRWRSAHCTGVNAQTGKWLTFRCNDKRPAVCGPPGTCVNKHKDCVSRAQKGECQKNPKFMIPNCRLACGKCGVDKPLKFTPYYPTEGVRCIRVLKEKFRRLQQKDMVCEKPRAMECSAKANKGDNWINNNNQKSDTIKCNENDISCKSGRELDCKTLRVRFLCPQEVNQCSELKKYGAACSGGRQCFPAPNHFHCRCPPNYMWSKAAKKCVKFCGECNAWGDPHYTTLNGLKYNFMGTCRYKFNGVCKQKDFGNKPNYDIYTENVACSNRLRKDGTCLKAVEIHLRQITIGKEKRNFVFKVVVGDNGYTINGKKVTDMVRVQNGVYTASVRRSYFSLEVYPLDLKILLNGMHLRARVPDVFRGKLCGLCGDCGTDQFTLRNGTKVSVPHKNGIYPEEPMRHVGLNWMENTPQFKDKKCGAEKYTDKCTMKQKLKVKEDSLCGIFLQRKGPIKHCIDTAKLNGRKFFFDCIFDLCEMGDPNKAVCGIVSAFAQQCVSKGVPINWRKPDFCPMKCPKDMVYRVDASCQKTCKRPSGKKDCGEEPAEGCVCKDGLYRLGNRCVTKCACPN